MTQRTGLEGGVDLFYSFTTGRCDSHGVVFILLVPGSNDLE